MAKNAPKRRWVGCAGTLTGQKRYEEPIFHFREKQTKIEQLYFFDQS